METTNKPCKRGHVGKRSPKTGKCTECCRILYLEKYAQDPERFKSSRNRWYHENKEKAQTSTKKWRTANPGKSNRSMKNWQEVHRARMLASAKIYRSKNKKAHVAHQSQRRAAKLQRTPKWANLEELKQWYQNCPDGMTVDHIIPLQGELVSGLHVPGNLQYLTMTENVMKNNRFDPWTWKEPKCLLP